MRTVFQALGRALPVGPAMLMLAACGSTTAPTAPAAVTATVAKEAAPSASAIVRGQVVDLANRPVANANVECTSDAQCTLAGDVAAQDGPDQGVKTNANGFYQMRVSRSGGVAFILNASARGFGVVWREVQLPDPTCTWDQPGCAVTVNFTLTPAD